MSFARWAVVFALFLLAVGTAAQLDLGLYIEREPTQNEIAKNFSGARLEPRTGAFLGAFIDLDSTLPDTYFDATQKIRRTPDQFEQKTKKVHASYFFYLAYGRPFPQDWVQLLSMQDKLVHIALEPNGGLDEVKDDAYLRELADAIAESDAKIFLRFASEMNGPWVAYHGNPQKYKEKWRLVARVMHERAPNVAMVWAPYALPINPIPDYYPGDDYVDWVGVNLYSVTYFNQDPKQPAREFHPMDKLDYIYDQYANRKPIMIAEYGATHYSALEDKLQVDFAKRCIYGLYGGLPRQYPRVKAIFYFNANNMELEHRMNNNYSVTQHPEVLEAYRVAISPPYFKSSASGAPKLPLGMSEPFRDRHYTPGVYPMPLREGETVSGEVKFSAWARLHLGKVVMRFRINGRPLYEGVNPWDWEVSLDTNKLPNGENEFKVECWQDNRMLGSRTVTINVQN